MSFPVIAWPGFFGYTGIRLARQSRGKSFYLLWIPACAGMTDKAGSCFIRALPPANLTYFLPQGDCMYLLDTNILSYWMRGNEAVLERLKRRSPAELSMSVITLAEILYGIEKSAHRKQERRSKIEQIRALLDIYAFDQAAASEYAIVRAQLERQGLPISERDVQIASIALANDLTVITHNVKEFGRVKNLVVEDWANQDDQLWRLQNDSTHTQRPGCPG